jgi:hypothetical protein
MVPKNKGGLREDNSSDRNILFDSPESSQHLNNNNNSHNAYSINNINNTSNGNNNNNNNNINYYNSNTNKSTNIRAAPLQVPGQPFQYTEGRSQNTFPSSPNFFNSVNPAQEISYIGPTSHQVNITAVSNRNFLEEDGHSRDISIMGRDQKQNTNIILNELESNMLQSEVNKTSLGRYEDNHTDEKSSIISEKIPQKVISGNKRRSNSYMGNDQRGPDDIETTPKRRDMAGDSQISVSETKKRVYGDANSDENEEDDQNISIDKKERNNYSIQKKLLFEKQKDEGGTPTGANFPRKNMKYMNLEEQTNVSKFDKKKRKSKALDNGDIESEIQTKKEDQEYAPDELGDSFDLNNDSMTVNPEKHLKKDLQLLNTDEMEEEEKCDVVGEVKGDASALSSKNTSMSRSSKGDSFIISRQPSQMKKRFTIDYFSQVTD